MRPLLATSSADVGTWFGGKLLLLVVATIAVLPLALRGTSCGQDFDFHLQNWLEVTRSWHQGVLYPHWAASANYGAGEPRFIFYPPLAWMLGASLGTVLPWSWTPFAFAFLALLGAGWSFQAMAREWVTDEAATAGACLYVVNPYLLFVLYERSALAELLAASWIPLLVLCGLRKKAALVQLALALAAIWLTNAPAAVIGCYMLAGLVAVDALQQRDWALVRRAAIAVPLGLGLAAFWLVPALFEQRWVQIGRAIGPLMRVEDSFLFEPVKWPGKFPPTSDEILATAYHNLVLHTASWIVVSLVLAAALAAWLSYRRRSVLWVPLVVVGAAIAVLQLRWSDLIWRITPELRYLQFPWRWMLALGMIAAALAGLALETGARGRSSLSGPRGRMLGRWFGRVAVLMLALGLTAFAALHFWQPCDEEDNVQAQIATLHTTGFEGTDEYTPLGGSNDDLDDMMSDRDEMIAPVTLLETDATLDSDLFADDSSEPHTAPGHVELQDWDTEHMTAVVTTPGSELALLRLMDYPGWRIRLNGSAVRMRHMDGLPVVPLAAGVNRIDIRWITTGDVWAGRGLSIAALAITLAFSRRERRKIRAVPIP